MTEPPAVPAPPEEDWRQQLVRGARDVASLVARGLVPATEAPALEAVVQRYQLLVSDYYLGLIDPADPACPIRKQALPDAAELVDRLGERADPIGDAAHAPTPILVRRYPDRALLFPTFRCPMFCRYCFRKVALNARPIHLRQELARATDWLRGQPEIHEIILSGGDPLMLSDGRLAEVLAAIEAVPSVRRIRIHTRFPVTLPQRITPALARLLGAHRPLYLVTHFNHPRELTPEARQGVSRLVDAGVSVLEQAVLLDGINADAEILATLFETLVDWQVRPYYLHHPDLTVGTQHFRLSLDAGLALVRRLRGRLTGLAWPTYVLDIPGGLGKVPVDSGYVRPESPGVWILESPLDGRRIRYVDPAGPAASRADVGASPLA